MLKQEILSRIVLALCLVAMVATSAFAFSLRDMKRSGGCCCDYEVCWEDICGGPDDCSSGDDCCFASCCY